MDRSWITLPSITDEYQRGLNEFLDFAFQHVSGARTIICPCKHCKFKKRQTRQDVYDHLTCTPFPRGYTFWFRHGEIRERESSKLIRRKPIRRKRLELQSIGEQISRGKMYIQPRTKSDGSFVNEEARTKCAEIAEIEAHDPTSIHVSSNDSLARVLGKEHAGRVRSLGSGICPNVAFGQPSYHGSYSQRASSHQSSHEVSSSEIQWQKKVECLENQIESLKSTLEFEQASRQKWERAVTALYSKWGMEMPDEVRNAQSSDSTQNEGEQHGSEDGGDHHSAEE